MSTDFEQCITIQTSCEFSDKIKINSYIEQKKVQQPHISNVVPQNIDESSSQKFIYMPQALFLFLIVAILIYYLIKKIGKQQNQRADLHHIQSERIQRQNHRQEEQTQFIESSCQYSDGSQNTQKWGEKKSKKKNCIQSFKLSDDKIQNKESQIEQIQDAQQVIDSMNSDSNQEKVQENFQIADIMKLDDQKPQIDEPPQQQQDGRTIQQQQQFDLQQKQHPKEIELDELNQFKQQVHKDEQQNSVQQEMQGKKVDIDTEQQKQNVEKQQNLIRAYQILNEKFYIPSFKSRQIDDDELKKFVRSFKDLKQFQEEYNLDGSQEQLFQNEIQIFIPIRGDGNCLFTSIGFQFIFYNLIDDQRFERLVRLIQNTEFKQIYKQNIQQNGNQIELTMFQIETDAEKKNLREQFENLIHKMKESFHNQNEQDQLKVLRNSINNYDGPFYGLLIIFMRNYFTSILQEFYDTNEMNYLIQNPELIQEINTWEHMYDETDIALKLFASKEQMYL